MRTKVYTFAIILSLFLALTLAAGCGSNDEGATAAKSEETATQADNGAVGSNKGDMAPDFTLKSLAGVLPAAKRYHICRS